MQEPAIVQQDSLAYYRWLRAQNVPGAQAYQMTEQRFGPAQTPQERAKRQQAAAENAGYAQVGGAIAGAAATNWALNGFQTPEWYKSLTGGSGSTPAVGPNVTQAQYNNWNTGANQATAAEQGGLQSIGTPKVISSQGGMSKIETPTGVQEVPTESLSDSGFWSNVNWGQVAQGGLALAQMYGAYKSLKSGDKVGGGINMAAGVGNLAAASGLASGSYVVPGLNIVAGAYGGYQTANAMGDMAAGSQRTKMGVVGGASSGAAIGAGVGSIVPGVGTAIGAGVGAIIGATAGAVGSWTGSHKGKAQFMRDQIRGVMQQNGILDKDFQGTLADGSKYDFGKDGSTLKWKQIDKIAADQPAAWNSAVPLADALAASYGFVGQKASDIAAWYAKGAVSNAGNDSNIAIQNMQHFAKQQGITADMIKQKLDEALKDNRITQDKYNYYLSGAQQLTGGTPAGQQQQIQRPGKGQVTRVSPGMYMNDQGKVSPAKTVREALQKNYQTTKKKEK